MPSLTNSEASAKSPELFFCIVKIVWLHSKHVGFRKAKDPGGLGKGKQYFGPEMVKIKPTRSRLLTEDIFTRLTFVYLNH